VFADDLDPRPFERADHLDQSVDPPRTCPSEASMRWIVGSETRALG